jgi:hypothetical protein
VFSALAAKKREVKDWKFVQRSKTNAGSTANSG